MIITGEMSDADEAQRKGLIARAVEPDQLMDEAMALAQQLAGQPPLSLRGVKRAVHMGIDLPLPRALELEALNFMETVVSRDAAAMGSDYMRRLEAGAKPVEIFAIYRNGHAVATRGQ